jgi:hypothetical protein
MVLASLGDARVLGDKTRPGVAVGCVQLCIRRVVGNILATNWMGHEGTRWYFTLKTGLEQLTQRF